MFKEGDKVWCVLYGEGVVESVNPHEAYGVYVEFVYGGTATYTKDGRLYEDRSQRMLFFSKPEVTGLTERPFDREYEDGERLYVVKNDADRCELKAHEITAWSIVVSGETEDLIYYHGRNKGTASLKKSEYRIFKM